MNPDAEDPLAFPGRRTGPAPRTAGRRMPVDDAVDRVPIP